MELTGIEKELVNKLISKIREVPFGEVGILLHMRRGEPDWFDFIYYPDRPYEKKESIKV